MISEPDISAWAAGRAVSAAVVIGRLAFSAFARGGSLLHRSEGGVT
jgi:hypothetical protein